MNLDLEREAIAARDLSEAVRASKSYEDGDELLVIQSETNLTEELERAVVRLAELEAHQKALKSVMLEQERRLARFDAAHGKIRDRIKAAFETAGLPPRLELPSATVSIGKGRPKITITSLLAVPKQFLRFPEPTANKMAIADEWAAGRPVDGTAMGNAEPVLMIRRT